MIPSMNNHETHIYDEIVLKLDLELLTRNHRNNEFVTIQIKNQCSNTSNVIIDSSLQVKPIGS